MDYMSNRIEPPIVSRVGAQKAAPWAVAGPEDHPQSAGFWKENKAVRVSFSGGILGLLFGSSRGTVESVLKRENALGWNLAEVIPDNPNLAIWIVRLLLLILTLGLWTISTGHLFIFERPR